MNINNLKLNDALELVKSMNKEGSMSNVTPPKPLETVKEIKVPTTPKIKSENDSKESVIREILLIRESQIEVVKYYLDSIVEGYYVYYETLGTYNLIQSLKPNLLREPYWVISTFGRYSAEPKKLEYNSDVINKYLNHIIISSNWGMLNEMNKEDWTYNLDYGQTQLTYNIKTVRSFGDEILRKYIKNKLIGVAKDPYEMERLQTTIIDLGAKNIVENCNKFISMSRYPIEEVVKEIKALNNISYKINELLKILALNIVHNPKSRSKKKVNWYTLVSQVVENYGEPYLIKSMLNGIEAMIEIKTEGNSKHLSAKFFKEFINEVDMLNLISIRACLKHREFGKVLIDLDRYMKDPKKFLIKVEV